ncbi:hypothetical protein M378DRAFT_165704 [Amanita muscaria Koide BX008]|uniref:Uncharacterized protein n=1 Tax=Amanita muscaria (strain Koide BX008) TaxID=946122 RepID=A0A0C2X1E9_AMAMK|nr:hypothetical protein M378DRAFT_165704 [Amanita muscaria Koide BX008]
MFSNLGAVLCRSSWGLPVATGAKYYLGRDWTVTYPDRRASPCSPWHNPTMRDNAHTTNTTVSNVSNYIVLTAVKHSVHLPPRAAAFWSSG